MPVELELGPTAQKFRDELRDWLDANKPDPEAVAQAGNGRRGRLAPDGWTERLRDAGYLCVSWPKEFGGRGLSGIEVSVMNEEFARAGLPRVTRGMGEGLVGPAIIVWGTDEQKAYFLRASSTAPTATARASASRTPVRTWRASRPGASSTATSS
jgi:hypothetical protein